MRRTAVPLLVAFLLLAAMPAHAASSTLVRDLDGLSGDTYVVTLEPDGPFVIEAGSQVVMDVTYPEPREDAAFALAYTDLQTQVFTSVDYFTFDGAGETHTELLTQTPVGVQIDRNEPGEFTQVRIIHTLLTDVSFPDRPWHLAVSAPGAWTFDVRLELEVTGDVTFGDDGTAGAGMVAAMEDFDGTAQHDQEPYTAGVDVHATASAPGGTRAFAVLFPFTARGAGWYGIDGPGSADHQLVRIQPSSGPPPAAHVLLGPSGSYDHFVRAEAWQHTTATDGRVAVFFAAPMPP